MFAVKNMDALLRLKLDMVYRGLPLEEAQKRYIEVTNPPAPAPAPAPLPPPPPPVAKPKRTVKRVKPATGKST